VVLTDNHVVAGADSITVTDANPNPLLTTRGRRERATAGVSVSQRA
jgi:S1-C subfamily serine protease